MRLVASTFSPGHPPAARPGAVRHRPPAPDCPAPAGGAAGAGTWREARPAVAGMFAQPERPCHGGSTRSGSVIGARDTKTTPSGNDAALSSATRKARRVLPTPPGPVRLTRRTSPAGAGRRPPRPRSRDRSGRSGARGRGLGAGCASVLRRGGGSRGRRGKGTQFRSSRIGGHGRLRAERLHRRKAVASMIPAMPRLVCDPPTPRWRTAGEQRDEVCCRGSGTGTRSLTGSRFADTGPLSAVELTSRPWRCRKNDPLCDAGTALTGTQSSPACWAPRWFRFDGYYLLYGGP